MYRSVIAAALILFTFFSCSEQSSGIYDETLQDRDNPTIPDTSDVWVDNTVDNDVHVADNDRTQQNDANGSAIDSDEPSSNDNDIGAVDNDTSLQDIDNLHDEDVEIPDTGTDSDTQPTDSDNGEVPDDPPHEMTVDMELPAGYTIEEAGTPVTFRGVVADNTYPLTDITMKWTAEQNGTAVVLHEGPADASGVSEFQRTFTAEEAGYYDISLTATAPDLTEEMTPKIILGICTHPFGGMQTFDDPTLDDGWVVGNDAYHAHELGNGWLELTGDEFNKQGKIYNIERQVSPGDVTLRISIRTGPHKNSDGGNTGADGFAMTVVSATDTTELQSYVDATAAGGCLGYGVAGGYCGTMDVTAFHIEFDTWYNSETGLDDPVSGNNHIAININGNPGGHLLYREVDLEDMAWHDIEIQTAGSTVTVFMNGTKIIDDAIPDFSFQGGYIMFSGSTGSASNNHSIDNLEVVQACSVPE